jgi:hypothetical protein
MKRKGKSIHSLDGEIIIIRQGLAIYKTFATPFYQVRIRDTVAGKYIVRSTKETARIKARVAAEELARDILGKIPAVPKHLSFEHYAKLYIQQTRLEVERSEKARSAIGNAIAPIENKQWGLIKYFGRRNIKEIASYDYTSYVRWFIEKRPDIAPSSIARTTSVFRSILRVALLDGVIHSIPETPKLVSSKPAARTFFRFHPLVSREKDDVVRMLKEAERMAHDAVVVRGVTVNDELRDIILFTLHSFVRPTITELYALRHTDVTVEDNPSRLLLTIRKGKTGYRVANTMETSVEVYQRIRQRNPLANPEDFLFFPHYRNRDTAKRMVMRQFNVLLENLDLKKDVYTGFPHSMYSLRHTSLSMRLVLSGGQVNIYTLAKNAGTSVEMLEQHYLRHLPISRELARNLQSVGSVE